VLCCAHAVSSYQHVTQSSIWAKLAKVGGAHPLGGACRGRCAGGRQLRAAGRREQAGDVALVLLHLELCLPLRLRVMDGWNGWRH